MPQRNKRGMNSIAVGSKKTRISSAVQNTMAIKIQQRFWYANARWNTKHRMAQRLLNAGLNIQNRANTDQLAASLMSTYVTELFSVWLKRLVGNHTHLSNFGSIINVFFLGTFKFDCVDRHSPHATDLVAVSELLMATLDRCLRLDYTDLRDGTVMRQLHDYVSVYEQWTEANEASLYRALLERAIRQAYTELKSPMNSARDDRFSLLIGGSSAYRRFMETSSEVQMVRNLSKSLFWGHFNLSHPRFIHELLLDENYKLDRRDVLPNFKYTNKSVTLEFLVDWRAIVMYRVRETALLTDMAQAMNFEQDQQWLDMAIIAEQMVPLLCRVSPAAGQTIQIAWAQCNKTDSRSVGCFLAEAAREVRYTLACEDVEICREIVQHHPTTRIGLSMGHFKQTEAWILRSLSSISPPMLRRLATGDSFALLKFHDQIIMQYVLGGEFVSPVTPPEVLVYDMHRMQAVFSNLCVEKEISDRDIRRMVRSGEIPVDLKPSTREAISCLRNIIFVCRFQHGDRIAKMSQTMAKQLALLDVEATML